MGLGGEVVARRDHRGQRPRRSMLLIHPEWRVSERLLPAPIRPEGFGPNGVVFGADPFL